VASFPPFQFRKSTWDWTRPYIAGVVNVTPDSFSDGGRFEDPDTAFAHAHALCAAGADLIDIGGESTRPGASPVPAEVEMRRVLPLIERLAGTLSVPISIDTTKAPVAAAAIRAGAEVVNDISGGLFDPELPRLCRDPSVYYVCGHVRGKTLDAVHRAESKPPTPAEVTAELRDRLAALPVELTGRVLLDPGLGFGKVGTANLRIASSVQRLSSELSCPVMVGPSRKRFVGELLGPDGDRDAGTVGACLAAVSFGAHVLRVHDVVRLKPALTVFWAMQRGRAHG
jgi:dihydropteroate synthase